MFVIDLNKLNSERLNATLAEIGITELNNLTLSDILDHLQLSSEVATITEHFPNQEYGGRVDLSASIQELRTSHLIADVIGPTNVRNRASVCFSTLLGLHPKEYLNQYTAVARSLCNTNRELNFVVWLEDTLARLMGGWEDSIVQQAVEAYQHFFKQEQPVIQIFISSQVAPCGLPVEFVEEKLHLVNTETLLSMMPFHLRKPMFIKVFDVIHFAWNCYLLYRYPCIHLAGINNKRHFQVFRKVVGQHLTAILLPLGSEDLLQLNLTASRP